MLLRTTDGLARGSVYNYFVYWVDLLAETKFIRCLRRAIWRRLFHVESHKGRREIFSMAA